MRIGTMGVIMTTGFGLLCCVNVLCFFPNSLLSNDAPLNDYRLFNASLGIVSSLTAGGYGCFALKKHGISYQKLCCGAIAGFILLISGITLVVARCFLPDVGTIITAGALCGSGLSITMTFWFLVLIVLPNKQILTVQGCQALVGGTLFIFLISQPLVIRQIIAIGAALLSLSLCLIFIQKNKGIKLAFNNSLSAEKGKADYRHFLSLAKIILLPFVAFIMVSLLYGVLTAVAMAPSGSSVGCLAGSIGGEFGAITFLLWAYRSKTHKYAIVLQLDFMLIALALMLAPFDALMLFLGAGYQICGLLLYSLILIEGKIRPYFSFIFIALCFAAVHITFLWGLYIPGWFGVNSYETFHRSTSLIIFMAYVVFAVLLFVLYRTKSIELIAVKKKLIDRTKEQEKLKKIVNELSRDKDSFVHEGVAKQYRLTKRETEIFCLLARGRDVTYICAHLFLARNTVKGYTKKIYAKLGVHSKQEIIDMVESCASKQNSHS